MSIKQGAFSFILFFILVVGFSSATHDLWNPDEPRFAQVSREMIETGKYWVPHLNGEVYTDKPPLYCWITAGVSKLFFNGQVNSFSSRFPSLLGGVGTLLLVFWMGKRMYGLLGGLFAMFVLATTYRFWWQAAWGQLDMLLCFFIVAALACFWKIYSTLKFYPLWQKAILYSLFYFSLAGGFLTKGPIGILFPCGIIFFFLLWEKKPFYVFRMWLPLGGVILAATIGVWIWGAYLQAGTDYLYQHFIYHNFYRYTDPEGHIRPFYYYFMHFPVDSLPWFIFIPFAFYFYKKNGFTFAAHNRFLIVWFLLIFVFFTLSSSKRNLYILPVYPAFALLIGEYLLNCVSNKKLQKSFIVTFILGVVILFITLIVAFPFMDRFKSARSISKVAASQSEKITEVASYNFFKESFLFYLKGEGVGTQKVEGLENLKIYLAQPGRLALVEDDDIEEVKTNLEIKVIEEQRVGSHVYYLISPSLQNTGN